ncbi:chemotaxis protein CheW [Marinobacter nauticus]
MKENSQSLQCVLIPVHGRQLLLPNVSIAEVVDFEGTETGANTPDWLVGFVEWRGLKLPVISYDAANDGQFVVPGENRGRIIVLNTIGPGHRKSPFMALVTQGIPSQTRLEESQVQKMDAEPGPADLMQVEVDGDIAWIPNLEHLESLAAKVMV